MCVRARAHASARVCVCIRGTEDQPKPTNKRTTKLNKPRADKDTKSVLQLRRQFIADMQYAPVRERRIPGIHTRAYTYIHMRTCKYMRAPARPPTHLCITFIIQHMVRPCVYVCVYVCVFAVSLLACVKQKKICIYMYCLVYCQLYCLLYCLLCCLLCSACSFF